MGSQYCEPLEYESRSLPGQLFSTGQIVRKKAPEGSPEYPRMIRMAQMAKLVGDDIIHQRKRGHCETPVEAKRPVERATRPTAKLVANEEAWRGDAELPREA